MQKSVASMSTPWIIHRHPSKKLQDINQQCNKYGKIILTSSNETYPRAYKLGGIMMGLKGHIAAKLTRAQTNRANGHGCNSYARKKKLSSSSQYTESVRLTLVKQGILLPIYSNIEPS